MLRPHEAKLLEQFGGALIAADDEGHVAYVTHEAARVLKRRREDMTGKPLARFMPERLIPLHEEGFRRYVESGESKLWGRTVEVPALGGDGEEIQIQLAIRVLRRSDRSNLVIARIIGPEDDRGGPPVGLEKELERRR